ncbi:MAG: hypothetical protein H7840_12255 [Alphaproteobacteria bacterium]
MKKFVLLGTVGISLLWSLGVVAYVTTFVGWDNLLHLLPSELAVLVLVLTLPLIVGAILFVILDASHKVDKLADTIGGQTDAMAETIQQVAAAVDEVRLSRDLHPAGGIMSIGNMPIGDLQAMLTRAISGAIEAQGGFHPPVPQSSGSLIPENIDPNDFAHLGTLMNLFTVALNDLSVITTRLLVRLLEGAGRGKEDVRPFIGGLLDAYGTGDKNVFFRALQQQLSDYPVHLQALKDLTANSPEIRRDVSKILREAEEIMSMVRRCDSQNLIRIVFEEGELWSLQQVLVQHFDNDGNIRT